MRRSRSYAAGLFVIAALAVARSASAAPTLTVDTPSGTVARPCLRLQATCTSIAGRPCDTITALTQTGTVIATAKLAAGSTAPLVLDQIVALSAFEGQKTLVYVDARNVDGVDADRQELVTYVDSSPTLILLEEVGGRILDFDDARVLFVGPAGVSVLDRATKVVTTLAAGNPAAGVLLANGGALWEGGEWKDGAFVGNDVSELRSAGPWLAWTTGDAGLGRTAHRRDLTTGTSEDFAGGYSPDIDETGALVYVDTLAADHNQRRVHLVDLAGNDEIVTEDPGFIEWSIGKPHVGGTALTWETADGFGVYDLALRTPQGAEHFTRMQSAPPMPPYRVRAGWFANVRPGAGGSGAWTRSPSGAAALASSLSGVDAIVALEPDGTIAYDVVSADQRRSRYFGAAGAAGPATPTRIGAGFGRLVRRGTISYQIVERTLFRVDTTVTTPLPACGGAADAGADASAPGGDRPGAPGAAPLPMATAPAADEDAGCASSGGARPSAWLTGLLGAIAIVAARRRARRSAQNLK